MKPLAIATLIAACSIIAGCIAYRLFDASEWVALAVCLSLYMALAFVSVYFLETRKPRFTPDEIRGMLQ